MPKLKPRSHNTCNNKSFNLLYTHKNMHVCVCVCGVCVWCVCVCVCMYTLNKFLGFNPNVGSFYWVGALFWRNEGLYTFSFIYKVFKGPTLYTFLEFYLGFDVLKNMYLRFKHQKPSHCIFTVPLSGALPRTGWFWLV